jgi:hypothetical protein
VDKCEYVKGFVKRFRNVYVYRYIGELKDPAEIRAGFRKGFRNTIIDIHIVIYNLISVKMRRVS